MQVISSLPKHLALLLRVVRLRAGVEQGELAQRLGISQATVSRIERGLAHPSAEQLQEWCSACHAAGGMREVVLAYARAGTEEQREQAQAQARTELMALVQGGGPGYDTTVPYFADVAAGIGETQEQRRTPRQNLQVPAYLLDNDPGCYALRVVGDSMAPVLLEGDIVVVSPASAPQDGCIVAAYVEPDGDVVKQYRVMGDGSVELRPLNPAYPTLVLDSSHGREARIWGRVLLQQREL
jgi:SOS-response transcriptional repressor LexA